MMRYNDLFREDNYGTRKKPYVPKIVPYEKLNRTQKGYISGICRLYGNEGSKKIYNELARLKYCTIETAIRAAQDTGLLTDEIIKELKIREETIMQMNHGDNLKMIGLYNDGMSTKEIAGVFGLTSKQVSGKIWCLKKHDKYKNLFNAVADNKEDEQPESDAEPEKEPEQDAPTEETETPIPEQNAPTETTDLPTETEQAEEMKDAKLLRIKGEGRIKIIGTNSLTQRIKFDRYDLTGTLSKLIAETFGKCFYGEIEFVVKKTEPCEVLSVEVE